MESFKSDFLKAYLAGGMASLSKRDIDALVMHLLDQQGVDDDAPLRSLSNQQVSVKLRTPVARIRALRYEATLKYVESNEAFAKWKFLEILAQSRFDAEKDKIGFVIEDTFTRNWIQGVLKAEGLVFDNSFNSEIVKVDSSGLITVLATLYDPESVVVLKNRVDEIKDKAGKLTFVEAKKEFLKGAANGLGKATSSVATRALLNRVIG
jgi:hypothetical protein